MAYDYEQNGQAMFQEAEYEHERRYEKRVERALDIAEKYVQSQQDLVEIERERLNLEKENNKKLAEVESKIDSCLNSLNHIETHVLSALPIYNVKPL